MNSDIIIDKHAIEVQKELIKLGIITVESTFINYNQISGGGTPNIFFELIFNNPSMKLIQKIFAYKDSNKSAEFEYDIQKALYKNGLEVPQAYFLKLVPNTRNLPYYVMEKIEGLRLVEVKEKNPSKYKKLIVKLLKELVKIHNLDPQLLPAIPILNIKENPYAPIDKKLSLLKLYLDGYPEELKELIQLYEWLQENKIHYPCKKLVITHGDYHSFNVFVQENQVFKILDWNSISLNDFRMDVAYTATTESYFNKEQTMKDRMNRVLMISEIYEKVSGEKIEGLFYFMILACTYNLIRMYSQMNNPNITGENEETVTFFYTVKDYFLFLAYVIREQCNIELRQIQTYFEEAD